MGFNEVGGQTAIYMKFARVIISLTLTQNDEKLDFSTERELLINA